MAQEAGDELLTGSRQASRTRRVMKRRPVPLEEREVGVHSVARGVDERLGHKGGVDSLFDGDLLDDGFEGHDVVGHSQGVGGAQVDLVLPGPGFMMGEFDRDAHVFEGENRVASEVLRE